MTGLDIFNTAGTVIFLCAMWVCIYKTHKLGERGRKLERDAQTMLKEYDAIIHNLYIENMRLRDKTPTNKELQN